MEPCWRNRYKIIKIMILWVIQGRSLIIDFGKMAILEYLEEAYPRTAALLPTDLIQRAQASLKKLSKIRSYTFAPFLTWATSNYWTQVRQICQLIISGIQPLQHRKVSGRARPDNPQEQKEWQAFYIKRGLTGGSFLSLNQTNEISIISGCNKHWIFQLWRLF